MAEKTIKARIRCKIDTAENWKTNNPVLLVGELGVESDTKLIKVGDGTTSWTSLSYLQYLPLSGGNLTGSINIDSNDGTLISHLNKDGTTDYGMSYKNNAFEFGNYGKGIKLLGNTPRPKYETPTTEDGGVDMALKSDIPTALSQLSGDETHRVVTDIEKQTWNNKSNFDGDYNSLANKPTIPTKTSQLKNDSGFATTSQIPDVSGKANLNGGNTFNGRQRFSDDIQIQSGAGTVAGGLSSNGITLSLDFYSYLYLKSLVYSKQWFIDIDSNGNLIFSKG